MTMAALEKQALALSATSRVRLVEKILASISGFTAPGIQRAWEGELEARVKEIREGKAGEISGEKASATARRKVNEARQSSRGSSLKRVRRLNK